MDSTLACLPPAPCEEAASARLRREWKLSQLKKAMLDTLASNVQGPFSLLLFTCVLQSSEIPKTYYIYPAWQG